jgi:hypothetical protein
MPGLLRGVVRTAAVAGTATAVSNRVSRRQAGRWAEQDAQRYQEPPPQYQQPPPQYQQPPPAPAAAPDTGNMIEQLKQLGELKDAGVLTEAEFAVQKSKILGS